MNPSSVLTMMLFFISFSFVLANEAVELVVKKILIEKELVELSPSGFYYTFMLVLILFFGLLSCTNGLTHPTGQSIIAGWVFPIIFAYFVITEINRFKRIHVLESELELLNVG